MGYLLDQELFAVVEPLVRHDEDAAEVLGRAIGRLMAQERCFELCGSKCQALNDELLANFSEWYQNLLKGTPT